MGAVATGGGGSSSPQPIAWVLAVPRKQERMSSRRENRGQPSPVSIPFAGLAPLLDAGGRRVMLRWQRESRGFEGFVDFETCRRLDRRQIEADLEALGLHRIPAGDRRPEGETFSGWVGFFGYEWLCALQGIECRAPRDIEGIPDGLFARPGVRWAIRGDRVDLYGEDPRRVAEWAERLAAPGASERAFVDSPAGSSPTVNCDQATYERIFEQAKEALRKGETYQIKLSIRHRAAAPDPARAFARLMRRNPAPEAFYLRWDDFALVSCSPETVIDLRGKTLATRPIGGTFPREVDDGTIDPTQLRAAFAANGKETAEHNMLIDLERNDLHRACRSGSVQITHLREVESYAHVHHLVTRIAGELRPTVSQADILRALLPGGSITGCPKYRTIELIDQWEPSFRGPYTGSFGTIADDGDMRFNLIIRTLLIQGQDGYVQAGGGIVIQSNAAGEYRENLLKGRALLDLLEVTGGPETGPSA
jgi:para-aminobenzoate synthetase component 1